MKDTSKKTLEVARPNISLQEGIEFCLRALYRDRAHRLSDELVRGLTFEELIGVLLLAKDAAKEHRSGL